MEKHQSDTYLKAVNITKSFYNIKALKGVNLEIKKGEIHAIVGENGAGKSTLISIISGVFKQDEGDIFINNEKVDFKSVSDAKKFGISTVFQELSLVQNLSIAENIFGERSPTNKLGLINRRKMKKDAEELLNIFKIDLDVLMPVEYLRIGTQQIIAIIKAISLNSRLIILDEPTSSLDLEDKKMLFDFLNSLKEKDVSIIYITHFLKEVFEIADRVTILRDGSLVDTKKISEVKETEIIKFMTGKHFDDIYIKDLSKAEREKEEKDLILRLEGISHGSMLKDISLDLHKGEILGICGLVGSGRTELLEIIYGLRKKTEGRLFFENREIKNPVVDFMKKNGVAYVCEDRKTSGLFLDMKIRENIYSVNSNILANHGFINRRKELNFAKETVNKFRVQSYSVNQKIINLSGGNQQKVLIAMWLMSNPKVLLVDEPTRGIDVGAKAEIHNIIRAFSDRGGGVILVSSEFQELINLSHKLIVINRGIKVEEFVNEGIKEELLIEYASGLRLNQ